MMTSVLRVKFEWLVGATSHSKTLLDWGQQGEFFWLPWKQQVQVDQVIGSQYAYILPRGNAEREFPVVARVQYDSAAVMQYELLDHDADLPLGIAGTLDLRVLNPAIASTETEAARTLMRYRSYPAAISSVVPEPDVESLACVFRYTLRIGELTKV